MYVTARISGATCLLVALIAWPASSVADDDLTSICSLIASKNMELPSGCPTQTASVPDPTPPPKCKPPTCFAPTYQDPPQVLALISPGDDPQSLEKFRSVLEGKRLLLEYDRANMEKWRASGEMSMSQYQAWMVGYRKDGISDYLHGMDIYRQKVAAVVPEQ